MKAEIEKHVELTGSERGKEILADWETSVKRIVRVIPKDKHALELAEDAREDAGDLEAVKG